ncbi:ABC transporter permease [Paraburkholderia caribensis]|uniref:ABC transporter permease n=1 Tax=Paraburkholderia caribensis TaxID=75105 RepID=UPI001CB520E7|nr:ABC transporter permease [Paraburkholderia caribensis]CAG9243755.1 Monosaccharide ABC transporter membrane protein, CUT2 family [Paraburkholderia caribensis]
MKIKADSRSGIKAYVIALPVLLAVSLAITTADFLAKGNLANLSSQIAPLAIASLGQLLVALAGGIDLSVGSTVSLTTCLLVASNGSTWGIALALGIALLIGITNGIAVGYAGMHPIIATLSSMTFVQGMALYWLPSAGGATPQFLPTLVNSEVVGIPATVLIILGFFLVVWWLLGRTRFGLQLFAVGANSRNASLNGVSDVRVIVATYALCSCLAAVAGIVLAGRVGSGDPVIGSQFALNSVTAVALGGVQFSGGVGSALGALSGVITLGLMRNGMNLIGVDAFLQSAATGLLLLAAISFQRRNTIGF